MITRYLYGITFMPNDFKMAIIEANKEQPRPTIQRILLLCYSYDPENKRFALDVTKITGTIIAFMILVIVLALIIKKKIQNKK